MSEDIFSQFFNLFNNNDSEVNWELSKQINKHLNKETSQEIFQLSNEELELCNVVLKIPTNNEYNSLNLASAVQIICYEIFLQINCDKAASPPDNSPIVSQEKMEEFYTHLEECLIKIGYYDTNNPRRLMHRLRRLFNRAQLYDSEWKILRGIISKIQEKNK